MNYDVTYHEDDNRAVVTLVGRLDASTSQKLREAILTPIKKGTPTLIADMSGVEFIDSSGLSAFVSAFRATREKGGTLVLVSVPQQAQVALKQTGLVQLFQLYANLEVAIAALDSKA